LAQNQGSKLPMLDTEKNKQMANIQEYKQDPPKQNDLLTSTECRFKSEDEQNDKKNLLK
jgi:hypothetical protein